jgi:4-hydroxy-tetrahydrodipicolinate synthase
MTEQLGKGKLEKAKELNTKLKPIFDIVGVATKETVTLPGGGKSSYINKCPNPVPVKTMMQALGMITGPCKPPLGRLTKNAAQVVRDALIKTWKADEKILKPIEEFYDVDVSSRLEDDNLWSQLSY